MQAYRKLTGDPTLPGPRAPERAGPSDRRTEAGGGEKAQCGLRVGGLRRSQAGAEQTASRIDGSQSECGAELGRRDGGDLDDGPPVPRPDATAKDTGKPQRDRVRVLDRGAGLPK